MQLSVVIPAYNSADFVGRLLDSLAAQRLDGIAGCEFIVVDDGSTDATVNVLATYPWVRMLRHERSAGAAAARNTGAHAAQGEWLVFLDADTRLRDADFLVRCIELFDTRAGFDAFSGCYYDENPGGGRFARYLDACEAAMRSESLDGPAPGCLSGSMCGIRRASFMSVGGFNERADVALEDSELGCRLSAAGYRIWLTSELRVEHRQPGFGQYVAELVPRTRHYVQLLLRFRIFNPMMGGAREGLGRGLLILALLFVAMGLVAPPMAAGGALLLGAAGWYSRGLVRRLVRSQGGAFLPLAFAFHIVTSSAIVAGGFLALRDVAARALRSAFIDFAVVRAYVRSLLSPRSAGYLIHFLTHRCNAHCGHCFDLPQRHTIGRDAEMDLTRIRRLARSVGPLGHLSLTGGEPLLRDDLADVIDAYYRAGVRSVSVSTNGSYPEKLVRLLERLPQVAPFGRIMVTLSVDGLGGEHDRLRRVPGLFAKVEHSLWLLCEARQWLPQLRVHVCIAASAANAGSVPSIVEYLRRFRLDQLELTRLRGKPADPSLCGIDDATYERLSACVGVANGAAAGLSRLFAGLDRAMFSIVRSPHRPWPCGGCLAGRRLAVIQADGTVLPCEMIRDVRPHAATDHDGFVIGRLAEYGDDLGALLRGRRGRRIVDYIRRTHCRCSFECAIFATMAYRPWTLPRFIARGVLSGHRSPTRLQRGHEAVQREPEEDRQNPGSSLEGERGGERLDPEQGSKAAREYPVFLARRAVATHVRAEPGGSGHDQHEVV
jgi:MoaA/NifB/PqqE/SkfB family radical SAM enzyme